MEKIFPKLHFPLLSGREKENSVWDSAKSGIARSGDEVFARDYG